jgi:hypothetical protein
MPFKSHHSDDFDHQGNFPDVGDAMTIAPTKAVANGESIKGS